VTFETVRFLKRIFYCITLGSNAEELEMLDLSLGGGEHQEIDR
jgi:hypothetical protein